MTFCRITGSAIAYDLYRYLDLRELHGYHLIMKRQIYLLVAVIALYLISSLTLHLIYGDSYGFLQGEDAWMPDGNAGWVRQGNPTDPMPSEPSIDVPYLVRYIPIFLPAVILILFLFTPLSRKLEETPRAGDESLPIENSAFERDEPTSRNAPDQ
jgi:hypothetical protein